MQKSFCKENCSPKSQYYNMDRGDSLLEHNPFSPLSASPSNCLDKQSYTYIYKWYISISSLSNNDRIGTASARSSMSIQNKRVSE